MTRKLRSAAVIGAVALLGVMFTGPAGQAAPSPSEGVLVIETVPELKGVQFSLDGRRFVSNAKGIARISTSSSGSFLLKLLRKQVGGPGTRATFDRWIDNYFTSDRFVTVTVGAVKRLQVGFDVDYSVTQIFVDQYGAVVDPDRIESVTYSNSLGNWFTVEPKDQTWVRGSRITRVGDELGVVPVPHSVRSVMVYGSNVVNAGQQKLLAAANEEWRVENLLFYSARFLVKDRLFGFPIGSSIKLEYPDRHVELHPLGPGAAITIHSLPRGDYRVTVQGPGILVGAPVALSRDQEAKLVLLSYYDISAAVLFALVFLVGLVVVGRWRHGGQPGSPPNAPASEQGSFPHEQAPGDTPGADREEVASWPG